MAVDSRVAGGGLIILLLSSGVGYVASSSLDGTNINYDDEIEEDEVEEEVAEARTIANGTTTGKVLKPVEQKLRNYKFSLIKDKTNVLDSVWNDHAEKINKKLEKITGKKLTGAEIKKYCDDNYSTPYKKGENWSVLKTAIRYCTELTTFKVRAEQLGIELIENGSSSENDWQTRLNKIGKEKLQEIADYTSVVITNWHKGMLGVYDLKNFCTTVGNINWSQVLVTNSTKQEFSNYLDACAKNENLDFSFWKGKPYKNLPAK